MSLSFGVGERETPWRRVREAVVMTTREGTSEQNSAVRAYTEFVVTFLRAGTLRTAECEVRGDAAETTEP